MIVTDIKKIENRKNKYEIIKLFNKEYGFSDQFSLQSKIKRAHSKLIIILRLTEKYRENSIIERNKTDKIIKAIENKKDLKKYNLINESIFVKENINNLDNKKDSNINNNNNEIKNINIENKNNIDKSFKKSDLIELNINKPILVDNLNKENSIINNENDKKYEKNPLIKYGFRHTYFSVEKEIINKFNNFDIENFKNENQYVEVKGKFNPFKFKNSKLIHENIEDFGQSIDIFDQSNNNLINSDRNLLTKNHKEIYIYITDENNNTTKKLFNHEILEIIKIEFIFDKNYNNINNKIKRKVVSYNIRYFSLPLRGKINKYKTYSEQLKITDPIKIKKAKLTKRNKIKILIYLILILILWSFLILIIQSINKNYSDGIFVICIRPFLMMTIINIIIISNIRIFIASIFLYFKGEYFMTTKNIPFMKRIIFKILVPSLTFDIYKYIVYYTNII